jgi:hypothetical protein
MKNKSRKKLISYMAVLIIGIFIIQACNSYISFRSNYEDANKLLHETENLETKPFLKAHLKNGDICILKDSWKIDTISNSVIGIGVKYDFNRKLAFEGAINIPIDSVAIFETNKKIEKAEKGRIAALSILAGIDVAVGLLCLSNPKACFGSCPTFYINENDNFHYADAEGFSNAISPSMEYSDIDALRDQHVINNTFSITMKNEALESHCVKDVKIFAYPIESNQRVYQSPKNEFYLCENQYSLSIAEADEGSITSLLKNQDQQERFSYTDEDNLNSKETIYLTFDNVEHTNNLGLILNFRQTLLTTYLFYSAMGYMGDKVGDMFAKLENNSELRDNFDNSTKLLGGIEIYALNHNSDKWELQNSFNETGPIAINKQIIPLQIKSTSSIAKIKIVLNKGLWRIDYASLTNIKERISPLKIPPTSIFINGKQDKTSISEINDPNKYLISMPGSEYKFNFTFPKTNANASTNYELFLYSKGYYLEWMREHWIKDKNLIKLHQMVYYPEMFLKDEAKDFKSYETTMEQQFWNSRIDTKTFTYYEN